MSIRDSLTGLYNRRYMEEALVQEMSRTQRNAARLAIIMLDIDHFKQFNDTFGHDAGDAVLRQFGEFLREHVRGSDIACRYGGDEFVLLLSSLSGEGGAQRAEQIREAVTHLHVDHAGGDLGRITLSLGVAVFPDHATEARDVVKAADIALYQAKRSGRDRVVVFSEARCARFPAAAPGRRSLSAAG
jgi:diguanylate cyclase (GGDEF)-like protein